jgi:hypothetical protein
MPAPENPSQGVLALSEVRFKDISPVRSTRWGPLVVPAIFVLAVIFGDAILRTMGGFGLLLTIPGQILNRCSVNLGETAVRLRTQMWCSILYSEIESVGKRQRDLSPGPLRYIFTPAQKQVLEAKSNVPLAIYLKRRRWLMGMSPLPHLFPRSHVDVYLKEEDESRFIGEIEARIERGPELEHATK